MFQNIILLSKDYNIIKQKDLPMSQIAGRCWIPKDFFFLWDRLHGEVTRRSLHYPVWASPDSSSAPSSSHQRVPGRPLYPRWLRTQESNSWQWAQLTDNRATKPQWMWYFQSKCVYIYPWTCENVIGIEIRNFKKLTPPGIEPRSAESSAVIIPLD